MSLHDRLKRFALRFLPERLLQNLKKIHYARSLRRPAEESEPDLKVLRHLVRPGARVVDLGANVGLYTKHLSALVGPFGQVFSVEPVPQTYEILASNIDKLGLINVRTFNVAVSASEGAVRMHVPQYAEGGENFYEARIVPGGQADPSRTVEVPTRTLDGLFGPADRVEFVKCDVEGHERSVLKGAADLLRSSKPAWLIEISGSPDRPDSPAAEVFALMSGHGYDPYWFDGTVLHRRRAGERSVNYFFLTPAHVSRLPKDMLEGGAGGNARRAA